MDVLRRLEDVPCKKANDRPLEDVIIEKMVLFGDNPVKDAEEIEKKKILKRMEERERTTAERKESALGKWKGKETKVGTKTLTSSSKSSEGRQSGPKVGRYLQQK